MNIQSSKHILLTGAGFTKNYGTPLASEMWAEIFNHKKIQAQPRIKQLMKNDCDYESIYYSIMEGSYTDNEKEAINDAVKSAYGYIDTIIAHFVKSHQHLPEVHNVIELIHRFGEQSNKSFIFTLNQDLFFERLYFNIAGAKLSIPGFKNDPMWFTTKFNEPLNQSHCCRLPDKNKLNDNESDFLSDGDFFLLKLHGSYNWISFDGTQKMVIGRGKTSQIEKEPLLNYQFEVFKEVISQDQRRLLIIGYGFGDDHINRIISESVRDNGLKIYIISPVSPKELKRILEKKDFGKDIWKGISGYFPYSLNEIFSEDIYEYQAIKQHFYDVFFE